MFGIENRHIQKKSLVPTLQIATGIAVALIGVYALFASITPNSTGVAILFFAISAFFFFSGFKTLSRLRELDELTSRKTLQNYLNIHDITDIDKLHCVKCGSKKIANRAHITQVFRECFCSVCGETLYYVERKDFV